jgi:hypothetical protein
MAWDPVRQKKTWPPVSHALGPKSPQQEDRVFSGGLHERAEVHHLLKMSQDLNTGQSVSGVHAFAYGIKLLEIEQGGK